MTSIVSSVGMSQVRGKIEAAPGSASTLTRGLTQAIEQAIGGLAVNATRLSGNDTRRTAERPHPELADAVMVSRFWRLVDRRSNDECWEWLGYRNDAGYGVFTTPDGRHGAHEMALSFTTGEKRLPELMTCHSCDNPGCCNPNHLRFDTAQANVDDKVNRGRHPIGSGNNATRLTEADVLLIRERRAAGARHKDLAIDFGITTAAVTAIVHGRNWKHVGGPITNRRIARTREDS